MPTPTHIYVQDSDRRVLPERRRLTEQALQAAAQLANVPVIEIAGRNELLRRIADDAQKRRVSVALIDLRGSDDDYESVGARIIATIRGHELLASACVPAAWTSYPSDTIVEICRDAGAFAVATDSYLLNTPGGLTELLIALSMAHPCHVRLGPSPTAMHIYHHTSRGTRQEHQQFKAAFQMTFDLPPSDDRLAALFAIANGLQSQTIIHELAVMRHKSPGAMKHIVESLTQRLRDIGADTARDVAVRFLADQVLPGMITHEPYLRVGDLQSVRVALEDAETLRDAWLPRQQQKWLRTFFSVYPATTMRAGDAVEARDSGLREVARRHEISFPEARIEIVRGALQLLDAKRDAFATRTRGIQ
jgi:hypothetical protein